MVETIKDIALVLGRIITILPLLLVITIFMGKRAIGELPIFDFLIIVTLGAIVGADIADPTINHIPSAAAILAVGLLQRLVARWKISSRKVGRLITFEPTVVVQNGIFLVKNIKKIRYSIDNILQMLREKDVFDVKEVETAVVEANGALSVLKKPEKNTVTAADIGINKHSLIAFPVIIEGEVYSSVLSHLNVDEIWLRTKLAEEDIDDISNIFFASITQQLDIHVSLQDETITVPPIKH
ncbi:DUF421 domain-containing protein [Alteribacillus sp. YIM 98480]|uniref:DUF421 domain-containing protein n=1 Tax=Alteribacillus sp. YIM 98480 TaxID=2606599 RepID=UPI001E3FEFE2|nr:DUF421 domain-containing protein [Alteribacillus sp. YIM 98480]